MSNGSQLVGSERGGTAAFDNVGGKGGGRASCSDSSTNGAPPSQSRSLHTFRLDSERGGVDEQRRLATDSSANHQVEVAVPRKSLETRTGALDDFNCSYYTNKTNEHDDMFVVAEGATGGANTLPRSSAPDQNAKTASYYHDATSQDSYQLTESRDSLDFDRAGPASRDSLDFDLAGAHDDAQFDDLGINEKQLIRELEKEKRLRDVSELHGSLRRSHNDPVRDYRNANNDDRILGTVENKGEKDLEEVERVDERLRRASTNTESGRRKRLSRENAMRIENEDGSSSSDLTLAVVPSKVESTNGSEATLQDGEICKIISQNKILDSVVDESVVISKESELRIEEQSKIVRDPKSTVSVEKPVDNKSIDELSQSGEAIKFDQGTLPSFSLSVDEEIESLPPSSGDDKPLRESNKVELKEQNAELKSIPESSSEVESEVKPAVDTGDVKTDVSGTRNMDEEEIMYILHKRHLISVGEQTDESFFAENRYASLPSSFYRSRSASPGRRRMRPHHRISTLQAQEQQRAQMEKIKTNLMSMANSPLNTLNSPNGSGTRKGFDFVVYNKLPPRDSFSSKDDSLSPPFEKEIANIRAKVKQRSKSEKRSKDSGITRLPAPSEIADVLEDLTTTSRQGQVDEKEALKYSDAQESKSRYELTVILSSRETECVETAYETQIESKLLENVSEEKTKISSESEIVSTTEPNTNEITASNFITEIRSSEIKEIKSSENRTNYIIISEGATKDITTDENASSEINTSKVATLEINTRDDISTEINASDDTTTEVTTNEKPTSKINPSEIIATKMTTSEINSTNVSCRELEMSTTVITDETGVGVETITTDETEGIVETVIIVETGAVVETITTDESEAMVETIITDESEAMVETTITDESEAMVETITTDENDAIAERVTIDDTEAMLETVTNDETDAIVETITAEETEPIIATVTTGDTGAMAETVTAEQTSVVIVSTMAPVSSVVKTVATDETGTMVETIATEETGSMSETITIDETEAMVETTTTSETGAMVETTTTGNTGALVETIKNDESGAMVETITTDETGAMLETIATEETGAIVETFIAEETLAIVETITNVETGAMVETVAPGESGTMAETDSPGKTEAMVETITSDGIGALVETITTDETGAMVEAITTDETGAMVEAVTIGETGAIFETVTTEETKITVEKVAGCIVADVSSSVLRYLASCSYEPCARTVEIPRITKCVSTSENPELDSLESPTISEAKALVSAVIASASTAVTASALAMEISVEVACESPELNGEIFKLPLPSDDNQSAEDSKVPEVEFDGDCLSLLSLTKSEDLNQEQIQTKKVPPPVKPKTKHLARVGKTLVKVAVPDPIFVSLPEAHLNSPTRSISFQELIPEAYEPRVKPASALYTEARKLPPVTEGDENPTPIGQVLSPSEPGVQVPAHTASSTCEDVASAKHASESTKQFSTSERVAVKERSETDLTLVSETTTKVVNSEVKIAPELYSPVDVTIASLPAATESPMKSVISSISADSALNSVPPSPEFIRPLATATKLDPSEPNKPLKLISDEQTTPILLPSQFPIEVCSEFPPPPPAYLEENRDLVYLPEIHSFSSLSDVELARRLSDMQIRRSSTDSLPPPPPPWVDDTCNLDSNKFDIPVSPDASLALDSTLVSTNLCTLPKDTAPIKVDSILSESSGIPFVVRESSAVVVKEIMKQDFSYEQHLNEVLKENEADVSETSSHSLNDELEGHLANRPSCSSWFSPPSSRNPRSSPEFTRHGHVMEWLEEQALLNPLPPFDDISDEDEVERPHLERSIDDVYKDLEAEVSAKHSNAPVASGVCFFPTHLIEADLSSEDDVFHASCSTDVQKGATTNQSESLGMVPSVGDRKSGVLPSIGDQSLSRCALSGNYSSDEEVVYPLEASFADTQEALAISAAKNPFSVPVAMDYRFPTLPLSISSEDDVEIPHIKEMPDPMDILESLGQSGPIYVISQDVTQPALLDLSSESCGMLSEEELPDAGDILDSNVAAVTVTDTPRPLNASLQKSPESNASDAFSDQTREIYRNVPVDPQRKVEIDLSSGTSSDDLAALEVMEEPDALFALEEFGSSTACDQSRTQQRRKNSNDADSDSSFGSEALQVFSSGVPKHATKITASSIDIAESDPVRTSNEVPLIYSKDALISDSCRHNRNVEMSGSSEYMSKDITTLGDSPRCEHKASVGSRSKSLVRADDTNESYASQDSVLPSNIGSSFDSAVADRIVVSQEVCPSTPKMTSVLCTPMIPTQSTSRIISSAMPNTPSASKDSANTESPLRIYVKQLGSYSVPDSYLN